jgi:hypothetical protein
MYRQEYCSKGGSLQRGVCIVEILSYIYTACVEETQFTIQKRKD